MMAVLSVKPSHDSSSHSTVPEARVGWCPTPLTLCPLTPGTPCSPECHHTEACSCHPSPPGLHLDRPLTSCRSSSMTPRTASTIPTCPVCPASSLSILHSMLPSDPWTFLLHCLSPCTERSKLYKNKDFLWFSAIFPASTTVPGT